VRVRVWRESWVPAFAGMTAGRRDPSSSPAQREDGDPTQLGEVRDCGLRRGKGELQSLPDRLPPNLAIPPVSRHKTRQLRKIHRLAGVA
jgi:hypothetical protein